MAKRKKIIAISGLFSLLFIGIFVIAFALKNGNKNEGSKLSSNETSEREKIVLDTSHIDF